MPNPYNLTDEQMAAYAAQVAEERASRRKQRTPADEEARYAAVLAQCEQLRVDAGRDPGNSGLALALGRAILHAELYDRNETAHTAYYARHAIIQAIERRITWQIYEQAQTAGNVPGMEQLFGR